MATTLLRQQEMALADTIPLGTLSELRTLGTGYFSKVTLVQHRDSGITFALKAIKKDKIVEWEAVERVNMERAALLRCSHPSVLRLHKTFVDDRRVYFLTEFLQGGDLSCRVHRSSGDGLPAFDAKFYAATTLLGLGHLHDKGYAHRDVRPENILLIDADGYAKIIAFGFIKLVSGRTYTLCGAFEYLAPELVSGVGHNWGVDYWALGVVIYEMLAGVTPFLDAEGDPHATMSNICEGRIGFPVAFPRDAGDLVRGLLRTRLSHRLGMQSRGHQHIMEHRWFSSIDFIALRRKQITAPWIPKLKDQTDATYVCRYDIATEFDDAAPMRTDWEWVFSM